MKKIVLAAILTTAATASAFAADLPRNRYARSAIAPAVAPMAVPVPAGVWTGFYLGGHLGYGFGGAAGPISSPKGLFGGIQGGYDYQISNALVGLAGDLSLSGIKGSNSQLSVANSWDASVRGRFGFLPTESLLMYGTAGFAFGGNKYTDFNLASQSATQFGWTAGLGGEYRFDRNWSTNLEYRYTSLGDKAYQTLFTGNTALGYTNHSLRAGVNYRF